MAGHHEIIRAQAQAAVDFDGAHRGGRGRVAGCGLSAYTGGGGAVDAVTGAAGLFEGLEDVQVRRREFEGAGEAVLPFFARAIAAEDHAAGAPGGFMVAADLDDEIPLLLRGAGEIAPVVGRPAADARTIEHRARRQVQLQVMVQGKVMVKRQSLWKWWRRSLWSL